MFGSASPVLTGIERATLEIWNHVWWIVFPLVAFLIFRDMVTRYETIKKAKSVVWQLLEIRIPKNILKTPKAMEQIFSSLHAAEKRSMSLEIVGTAGDAHFYIRTPKELRNLIESAIYAQYGDAEIREMGMEDDYTKQVSPTIPNEQIDVYGAELIFKNESAYPIRTYPEFEESVEERRVDPISALTEVMSKLKSDEQMWVQILIEPADDTWKKDADAVIDKITGKKKNAKGGSLFQISMGEALSAPFSHPSVEPEKKSEDKTPNMTPGQRDILEHVEAKIAKLGFKSTIRFVYIDRRASFSRDNVIALLGTFRQFNTQNLNRLEIDKEVSTADVKGLFADQKLYARKKSIFRKYCARTMRTKPFILNTEELATLYHFPTVGVRAPSLARVESKKGGPPPSLPLAE